MHRIMPDKLFSAATYCTSGGLICTGLFRVYDWLHTLDWNKVAVISGIIIGVATYFTNLYFQWRQTRAIEKASEQGKAIVAERD